MILRKNEQGGILPVLLLLGVAIAGLAYYVIGMMKQAEVNNVRRQFALDVNLSVNEIRSILTDPAKCLKTFESTFTPNFIVEKIDEVSGNIEKKKYFTLGNAGSEKDYFGHSNFNILEYELLDGPKDFLFVKVKQKGLLKAKGGPDSFFKKIEMYVEMDGGGNLKTCRSLSDTDDQLWSRGSGVSVYYNGRVGIETESPVNVDSVSVHNDDPDAEGLTVDGVMQIIGQTVAKSYEYDSDEILKESITSIENSYEIFNELNGHYFQWERDNSYDYGFIAQEIEKILPEAVFRPNNRGRLSVDYGKIVPILVEAMKAQQQKIEKLTKRVEALRSH
ncbi:MAG: tail fiber domain-containing protein [Bacteriovoracaceae bacterium]